MVILSAAIVTSGKTLLARQFVEMTRLRIEGLLSAFPKLIESGRDHTFIETETVRYVYQPMESLFLLLVTNKSSNILEDLETLRLLAKVVQDCCQIQVNEELVLKNAFDLVFAFDEVVSFGHRESVTLSQVKTYCEMDSHEEKLADMLKQSKENEAREMAKKKQMELAKLRASQPKDSGGSSGNSFGSSMPSMGSSSFQQESMSTSTPSPMDSMPAPFSSSITMDDGPAPLKPNAPKKGMMLGKKKPGDLFAGMGMSDPAPSPEASKEESVAEAAPPAVVNPLLDPVKVEIDEQIKARLEVEGGLSGEAECTGDFRVTVLDDKKADLVCFKLAPQDQSFKYKVHPNLNKQSHASNILEVRDESKKYKANMPVPLVKWRNTSTSEDFLPISLSCWPSQTSDGTQIVLEYELTDTNIALEDIHIAFPCPPNARPSISSAEPGQATYDAGNQQVHWVIPSIDSREGSSGTLEFSAAADTATLLPYQFQAVRRGATKCPMEIVECYHQADKSSISFALEKTSTYIFSVGE
jgi:hypothetical protein